jgi:hypothetical protein
MNKRGILLTAVWATGTFAVALATAIPMTLDAADPTSMMAAIRTPQLTVNGVKLTVNSLTPGDQGTMVLDAIATNPGTAAATANFTLHLYTSNVPNPMSRTAAMPTERWVSDPQTITVAPGRSQHITLTTSAISAPPGMITVTLASGDQTVMAYMAPMAAPTTRPAVADAVLGK